VCVDLKSYLQAPPESSLLKALLAPDESLRRWLAEWRGALTPAAASASTSLVDALLETSGTEALVDSSTSGPEVSASTSLVDALINTSDTEGLRETSVEDNRPPLAAYRESGERLPESRCFVEGKRSLCQLSSKRSEDNWHRGLLSSTETSDTEGLRETSTSGAEAMVTCEESVVEHSYTAGGHRGSPLDAGEPSLGDVGGPSPLDVGGASPLDAGESSLDVGGSPLDVGGHSLVDLRGPSPLDTRGHSLDDMGGDFHLDVGGASTLDGPSPLDSGGSSLDVEGSSLDSSLDDMGGSSLDDAGGSSHVDSAPLAALRTAHKLVLDIEIDLNGAELNAARRVLGLPQVRLYKILFHFKALLWESIILFMPPTTCKAYPIAKPSHDHCSICAPPPTSPFYDIHHTILVMAISCEGQAAGRSTQDILPLQGLKHCLSPRWCTTNSKTRVEKSTKLEIAVPCAACSAYRRSAYTRYSSTSKLLCTNRTIKG